MSPHSHAQTVQLDATLELVLQCVPPVSLANISMGAASSAIMESMFLMVVVRVASTALSENIRGHWGHSTASIAQQDSTKMSVASQPVCTALPVTWLPPQEQFPVKCAYRASIQPMGLSSVNYVSRGSHQLMGLQHATPIRLVV